MRSIITIHRPGASPAANINPAPPNWWQRFIKVSREHLAHAARQSPARLAVMVFLIVIALFTLLLMMPWATSSGLRGASLLDALFTATSATTVTGLTVVETGSYWSGWGLVVILIAIKVGGLGIMTVASIFGRIVSKRIGLTQRMLAAQESKTDRLGELRSLLRVVLVTSTLLEVLVMVMLFPRFLALHEDIGQAAWRSIFYGISAFNNAGFSPTPGGIPPYAGDWLVLVPLMLGVFIGALGFPVILNILNTRKNRRRAWKNWSIHTKLTLITSLTLVLLGALAFALLEWDAVFADMGTGRSILNSFFASVMTRSGGFHTVDIASMSESSLLVTDALMFIGGGSASTGGGIKVTTLAVMLLAIRSEARGDKDIEVMGRRIPRDITRLAISVLMVGFSAVFTATLMLLTITDMSLDIILFEVLSAFGTVGLSTGITAALPDAGRVLLIILMFVGRTGTITFAAALAQRDRRRIIRYPEERPIIG